MLRYLYLRWFSQPAADRLLYKLLKKRLFRSIVEVGIGQGIRTQRMFDVALRPAHDQSPLRYTGIDLFEARGNDDRGLSLKAAYSLLKRPGVQLQLVPGDPLAALSRMANSLRETDLLIISHDQSGDSLAAAWFWVPRMLHSDSLVYLERPGKQPGQTTFQLVSALEIARWASQTERHRRRAA